MITTNTRPLCAMCVKFPESVCNRRALRFGGCDWDWHAVYVDLFCLALYFFIHLHVIASNMLFISIYMKNKKRDEPQGCTYYAFRQNSPDPDASTTDRIQTEIVFFVIDITAAIVTHL